MGRREATRARLVSTALDLFERQGYEVTTVEQIAAATNVTSMTFYRYFGTKEAVVLSDPYDAAIATAVTKQPEELAAFERVRRAFVAVLGELSPVESEQTRRRIRVVAAHPGLRARAWGSTQETQRAIVDALVASGVSSFEAEVASGACLGALTGALLDWGGSADIPLAEQLRMALVLLGSEQKLDHDHAN